MHTQSLMKMTGVQGPSKAHGGQIGIDDLTRVPRTSHSGVEGNSRLTGLAAAVLLVLLAAEGATLLSVHRLVTPHVVIGMLLVPPVLVKMGSIGWRFVRYYSGNDAYREKGPPVLFLRLLGPAVVLLTIAVFGSGIAVLFVPESLRSQLLFVHKASFVLWFGAMTFHVLGHILDTARLAPADILRRTRRQVQGAGARLWTVAGSLVIGAMLGIIMLPAASHWITSGGRPPGG
jgi:hypothetical protein